MWLSLQTAAMAQVVRGRYFHLLFILCFCLLNFGLVEGIYLPVLQNLIPRVEGEVPSSET